MIHLSIKMLNMQFVLKDRTAGIILEEMVGGQNGFKRNGKGKFFYLQNSIRENNNVKA